MGGSASSRQRLRVPRGLRKPGLALCDADLNQPRSLVGLANTRSVWAQSLAAEPVILCVKYVGVQGKVPRERGGTGPQEDVVLAQPRSLEPSLSATL